MFESPEKILVFWFGYADEETVLSKDSAVVKRWFGRNPSLDMEIRDKFENYIESAKKGDLDHWQKTPNGRLAFVILADQFTRNIYQDSLLSFSLDDLALKVALNSIYDGVDEEMIFLKRQFFYMPLMHSENIDTQKKSLQCFERLVSLAKTFDARNIEYYKYIHGVAKKHYEVIEMFGRFPERNKILKRESTVEEQGYLKLTKKT